VISSTEYDAGQTHNDVIRVHLASMFTGSDTSCLQRYTIAWVNSHTEEAGLITATTIVWDFNAQTYLVTLPNNNI
jgi:hypothetical protein